LRGQIPRVLGGGREVTDLVSRPDWAFIGHGPEIEARKTAFNLHKRLVRGTGIELVAHCYFRTRVVFVACDPQQPHPYALWASDKGVPVEHSSE
jgi:hypothetical protein